MPALATDGHKLAEMLVLHGRGLSQRDVAEALGVSQRAVCYALKRLHLPPNGYKTAASRRKRAISARDVGSLKRIHAASASLAGAPRSEAQFPIIGAEVPSRLGYYLFGALCRADALRHGEDVAVLPMGDSFLIRGTSDRVREVIATMPPGTVLRVADDRLAIGAPTIRTTRPASRLSAWCVTIKGYTDREAFEARVRVELTRLGISDRVKVTVGARQVVKIKGVLIVGYEVIVARLHPRESLVIQAVGLGGRRRFGCGVFVVC